MKIKLLLFIFLLNFSISAQTSNIPDYVPLNGLLAYYPFNGNADDISGNGSNGIGVDVEPTYDRFLLRKSAYYFNGTSSNIEADVVNYPLKGGSRTITGWFQAQSPAISEELDFCLLNYGNVSDPNYWFKISFHRKGYLDIQFDSKIFQSNNNYFNGEWTFFAMVFNDQTNTFSLYINNILTLTGSADLYTNGFGNLFRIGKNKSNNYFEGSIDDIGIWNRILTAQEITALYNAPKPIFYTLIPDINFENKLIELGFDEGAPDGKVLRENIQSKLSLNISSSTISDLTGIEDFEDLKYLNCTNNNLSTINLTKNDSLRELNCVNNKISSLNLEKNLKLNNLLISDNKLSSLNLTKNDSIRSIYAERNILSSLNLSKNKKLNYLNISYNKLSTLDISENTLLEILDVSSNNLTSLNLKNGNNILLGNSVNFIDNPNLSCIQVDDAEYSNTNWTTFKDATATFNTNCPLEYIALQDSNFEQKLIDLGIDNDGLNGKISSSDINTVTSLDLSYSNITNLSGIEGFTSLSYLDCSNNQLTNLDLTNNVLLETLNASSNKITSLDLSKNSKLTIVYVVSNSLVFLNLQNGNNTNMIILNVTGKKSASAISTSFLGLNQLACVKVDDASYSNTNWSKIKEPSTIYSATCSLGIEDSAFDKVLLYPNPTKDEVTITNIALQKATVYNVLGQLVKSFTLNSGNTSNTISLGGLPKGVYYVYLINQEAASVKKVIVE
jgi:Leucine-rich repeat (LRR) protein